MSPWRKSGDTDRQPHEEWEDYVSRLEEVRFAARTLRKKKEVKALEYAAEKTNDPELRIAAKDAAREFQNMVRKLRQAASQ